MSKIAYIFPGQGAQYFGMGQDFYESFAESREIFDKASDLLSIDMKKLCFEENDQLNLTEYTQAAMVTVSAAILTQINKENLSPVVCAGLSLGEYSALLACGALSFEDAIQIVRQRGILMQNTVPAGVGGMYAIIGLDPALINKICEETDGIVSVANYNYPEQTVITGELGALEKAKDSCVEAGAKRALSVKVSGPFHSHLLIPAGEELKNVLDKTTILAPKFPYISNVNAEFIYSDENIRELLSKQVYSPVKWMQSVDAMISSGVDTFIEIGPKKTLTSMIKKMNTEVKTINIDKVEDLKMISEVTEC